MKRSFKRLKIKPTYFFVSSFLFIFLSCSTILVPAQNTIKIKDFYPLGHKNEWRYTAPPNWKDGDYISQIIEYPNDNKVRQNSPDPKARFFRHYDATRAAKLLHLKKSGIYYIGEEFAGGESWVIFDKPIRWFSKKLKIGQKLNEERVFTRYFKEKKSIKGNFKINQTIVGFEDVRVSAGNFKKTLRIDSETFWDLGDGTKARSVNTYHYARKIGVVKARARFIIINKEGKEIINRLIETDLKNALINGKKIKNHQN